MFASLPQCVQRRTTRMFSVKLLILLAVVLTVNFAFSSVYLRTNFFSMHVDESAKGELNNEDEEMNCNATKSSAPYTFTDRVLPHDNTSSSSSHKIPRIIHMLSTKTRCTTKPFHDNHLAWKKALPGHSFLFHDGESLQRLLSKSWPDFVNLRFIDLVPCMNGQGAAVADLARLLIVYEYGGLYVDTDEGPGSKIRALLASNETIDSEAILFENRGAPMQACFLASPRHPFLYYAIMEVVDSLLQEPDVGQAYIPFLTGPEPFRHSFAKFRGMAVSSNATSQLMEHGRHVGKVTNKTVDVIFSGNNRHFYVKIGAVGKAAKEEYYKIVGAKDFVRAPRATRQRRNNLSCMDTILKFRLENRSAWEGQ